MTTLNLATLEKMLTLLRKKEALMEKVDALARDLKALEAGGSTPAMPFKKRKALRVRRRGKSEELVLAALKTAGSKGLSVKEIALRTKIHVPTLRVWIYTAGKKLGLKKLAPGRFALPS